MDMILGILLGESYNGIRALEDLSMCVKIYQQVARLEVKEQRARESNTKEYRIRCRSRSSAVTLDPDGAEK